MLTWYFNERSTLITNGYHCWLVPSFKPFLSKFESNPSISLQVTVFKSNKPLNFSQRWKKVNFVCWLNNTFCEEKPHQKPRPSSINIIRTLLRRKEWFTKFCCGRTSSDGLRNRVSFSKTCETKERGRVAAPLSFLCFSRFIRRNTIS